MVNGERTPLEKYLFEPSNSCAKESLINNKLFYDLKLAAAERGYFLNVYTPEVDKEGFDIILDDGDILLKVQLKTVMEKAPTTQWNIHKSLLRPNNYICEDLGFEPTPTGTGYQGGIILIEVEDDKGLKIKYYYTDIIIIIGLREKIINVNNSVKEDTINKFFSKLFSDMSHEKINVHKSMFLSANSRAGLLALMGIHNTNNTGTWRFHIQKMINPANHGHLPSPYDKLKQFINEEIGTISDSIKKR